MEEKSKDDCLTCKTLLVQEEISLGVLEGLLPGDHPSSVQASVKPHGASLTNPSLEPGHRDN